MPGPPPKHPSLRRRNNKAATRAILSADHDIEAPPLPDAAGADWHELTKRWWADLRASPMATEYIDSDLPGLYRVAMLTSGLAEQPK
jgi:hypothetical protein